MTDEAQLFKSFGAACVTADGELRAYTRELRGMVTFRLDGMRVADVPEAPHYFAVGAHEAGSEVTCFAQRPGVHFFGTNRGLLVHADFCQEPFRMGSPNRRITALCMAGDGTLFAGTTSADGCRMVLFSAFRATSGRAPERTLTLGIDQTFRSPRERPSDDRAVRAIFARPDLGHGEGLIVAGDDGVFERVGGVFRDLWASAETMDAGGLIYSGLATPNGLVFLGRESGLWFGDEGKGWRPCKNSPLRVTAMVRCGASLFFASVPPRENKSEVFELNLGDGNLRLVENLPWFEVDGLLNVGGRVVAFGNHRSLPGSPFMLVK